MPAEPTDPLDPPADPLGLTRPVDLRPTDRVVGLSKLARVVEVFARRLQTQETMTAQIAETIDRVLKPKGVAVMIEAVHQCMSIRGVRKPDVATITTQFTGIFKEDPAQQARFMQLATERGRS